MSEEIKESTNGAEGTENQTKTYSEEEVRALLEGKDSEYAKLKVSFDKASKEIADFKKARKESLSEEEQKAEHLRELQEELAALKRESKKSSLQASLLKSGTSADVVEQLSEAFLSGNDEDFANAVGNAFSSFAKQIEELNLKGIKKPEGSMGSKGVTKETFKKMTLDERLALKNEDPTTYYALKGDN